MPIKFLLVIVKSSTSVYGMVSRLMKCLMIVHHKDFYTVAMFVTRPSPRSKGLAHTSGGNISRSLLSDNLFSRVRAFVVNVAFGPRRDCSSTSDIPVAIMMVVSGGYKSMFSLSSHRLLLRCPISFMVNIVFRGPLLKDRAPFLLSPCGSGVMLMHGRSGKKSGDKQAFPKISMKIFAMKFIGR